MQQTLASPLKISGIGLHAGLPSVINILPAEADSGIVFCRTDIPTRPQIKALYNHVVDTRNCTCLGDKNGNLVSTIEHLMAALYAAGIDNAFIETDNQEIPIMDGSGAVFYQALKQSAKRSQSRPRKLLRVLKTVSFCDDKNGALSLSPSENLNVDFAIDFPSPIVGHQEFHGQITSEVFEKNISPCRTFCEKYQVDYLRSIGLIQGGSLENAVVLDGDRVLNEEGFRIENECVNHKVLDVIGDLYTSGFHVLGTLKAERTGHFHTNELLKLLFADKTNYQIEDEK